LRLLPREEIKAAIFQIADARRKAKVEQMTQPEHMVGRTACISVVFLDLQTRLMIEQLFENVRCLTGCRRNDLSVVLPLSGLTRRSTRKRCVLALRDSGCQLD
jgi:hypothetical protein